MSGSTLYPSIEPYATGRLDVGDGHQLYWELCGNPEGQPAVFLHGGPGSGSFAHHRRLFDPARYRILVFDQRGAGRSTPLGRLEANTTWHLVDDLERLREMVGVERWLVFGGSWGATLALVYAETHPQRVSALVLRGVFTGRRSEIDWFYRRGASLMFPDHWADFLAPLDAAERADPVRAFNRRLNDPDPAVRAAAAAAWSGWERRLVTVRGGPAGRTGAAGAGTTAFAAIENHYVANGLWLEEGRILANAGRLAGIPGVVVQGRWDMVTPAATSHALTKAWPEADYRIVESAGHAFSEAGIVEELVAATDRFAGAPDEGKGP